MLSFKKTLFGLMMTFAFVMGTHVDASLTKSIVGNTQYQNNGMVTYNVSYTNTGSTPLTVRLSDTLPISLAPIPSAATCDGTISPGSSFVISQNLQNLYTNFCTLQPGQSAGMTYSAMILSKAFVSIINTANVASYSGSAFINNQTASASFSSFPVLSVNKLFTGFKPQRLNDLVTFKIKVTNSGAAVANNIVVSDNIPNGFEFVSSTLPGTPSLAATTNTVSWVIPTLAANSSNEYTVIAKLATSIPGAGLSIGSSVMNTVTISTGSTTTPSYVTFGSGGTTSSVSFKIAGIPSVTLTKVLTFPSNRILSFSGATASYTITVTNTGTETAIGSITDILPSELTGFSSNISPSVINGNTWTWTGIALAPGATTIITVNGILGSTYPSSRIFTNIASFVYASNSATGGLTNNGIATGLIQGLPNLVLDKNIIKSAPNGQSGDVVVYSLTVTNSSPTVYTGTRCIVDAFPSQITLSSSSIAQSNCGTPSVGQITFSGTTLPATIILTGMLNTTVSSGTVITNSGVVSLQTGLELLSTDNTDSAAFTVGGLDLVFNKTVGATTYTGTPGTPVTYTLQYTNNGNLSASGVVLTDTLPSHLVYNASSRSGAILSGSTVSRNLGTLAAGQSGSLTLTALISGYVQGGIITNTASISTVNSEPNIQNNIASASFTVTPALADLKIVKSIVSQGTYISGTQYTFRFDVSNIGGLTATGVRITDLLPSLFTYLSGSTNLVTPSGAVVSWTNISNTITSDAFVLSPGQSGHILLTTVLNNNILTTTNYTNTGTIASVAIDASLVNNMSVVNGTITAPVISCSGLQYTITANSPLLNPVGLRTLSGVAVSYTYALINNLPLPLESLTIGTTWPSQLSTPSRLVGGAVASVSNIPVGSGVSYTLASTTTVDGISTLTTPANFTVKVAGGQPFTCTASSIISVSQSCGNSIINTNLGEQCENHNGTVLVAPGVSFNASSQACDATCKLKTTKITNCVDMTVGGVVKNVCVYTGAQAENPFLTIKKYVNNNDAQDNSTAVAVSNGSTASYRVVITNSSSFTAYNVRFTDVIPNGVSYINNSVVPNTISYTSSTRTLAGIFGNLAPGASFTVTFDVTVNNSNGFVTNIATVNYTDVLGVPKLELSDQAVITLGSNPIPTTCNNGIKEGSEQCDIGNLPRAIGNYLDTTTNFPSVTSSFNHKGKLCTSSCIIQNTTLGICGDGILGRLEQCDLGGEKQIGNSLNTSGTFISAGIYGNGTYTCTNGCAIKSNTGKFPAQPACWYTDTIISIMTGEYLPLAWDIELGTENLVDTISQCNGSNNGAIVKDRLRCTIEIYNKGEESNNGLTRKIIVPCKNMYNNSDNKAWTQDDGEGTVPTKYKLFSQFAGPKRDPSFVQKPYGTYYFEPDEVTNFVKGQLGEYKFSLEKVDYSYCNGTKSVKSDNPPYARVCQVNFAVTRPYLMQKGSVSSRTNADLSDFYTLGGDNIYKATDLDKVNKLSLLDYANLSSTMKTLTSNLISKYEKIAVAIKIKSRGTEWDMKKVPGKSIYIMNGGSDSSFTSFTPGVWNIPTTLIIKGNIDIVGDVPSNILLIATGKIRISLPQPEGRDGCNSQVIRGIIVAQGGFDGQSRGYINNSTNAHERCRKGNLQVYGVLVGNNLDDLVNSRRSHLEHWFTFKKNRSTITVDDPEVKAERRDEIYKGASVYIEQNPSLWRDMPPGADEFLKTLNVSRS